MANTQQQNIGLTAEKLERVQEVLRNLKADAQQAHTDGDMFMLAVYNDLLQVCSPIVVKSMARLEREDKASLNKHEKAMRKAERKRKDAEKAAAEKAERTDG